MVYTAPVAPRNIWCVGCNYAEHIKELDNQISVPNESPMIFLKAGSSVLSSGQKLALPSWSTNVHHEVELAIELNGQLQPGRAGVALDLTARDIQAQLREKQWPWTLAKSFPQSTPLGPLFPLEGVDLQQLELHLTVNGETRQTGSTSLMMFKIPVLLDYVRKHFPVVPGDIVLTGTPAGVSALKPGDKVVAQVLSGSQVLSSGNWEVAAEDSIGQQATQKIVINACYGGFGLSKEGYIAYATAKGLPLDPTFEVGRKYAGIGYCYDVPRDDPDLVRIVQELGSRANGQHASLKVVEIPANVPWQISEYDGDESVSEYLGIHRTWA